jgi:hypothetical protein
MSNWEDNLLSVYWAVVRSLLGRAALYVLACTLGVMAAYETAEHKFVWPWEALAAGLDMAFFSFVLMFFVTPIAALIYAAVLVFLGVFLWREEIHWAFLLIPMLLVWYWSHTLLCVFPI